MPKIRLLQSVVGERGQVRGDAGEVLVVDAATARAWCDGERAERVLDRSPQVEQATGRRSFSR